MTNVILYEIRQQEGYSLGRLVDAFVQGKEDDTQGIIVHEYDEYFLKATFWKRKLRREYRYNIQTQEFEPMEEEIVSVSDFGMQIGGNKLVIFGNRLMAQRIITLISFFSKNAYTITEYIIDIKNIVKKICMMSEIELLKMKLIDITIDKKIIVDCNVNLAIQDSPEEVVLKYADNIIEVSFRIMGLDGKINMYKSGRFSLGKIQDEEKDELIQKIMEIVC